VGRTLLTLGEIKVVNGQHVKKEALGARKLLAASEGQAFETGLSVELLNEKGDVLASVVAGEYMKSSGGANSSNFNGTAEQRFIRVPSNKSDGDTVWLINDVFYDIQATPQEWLDKGFFDVRKLKDVAIADANPEDSWAAQRKDENSEFTLADARKPGEELDTAKAGGLSTLLSQPNFTDVLTKDKITPDLMKEARTVKIDTFENFHYLIKLAEKKEPGANEPKDYLSMSVTADFPKERKPEPNEKPEDKKKKDDEFAAKTKELEAKLTKEKGYEGWTYEVANYVVSTLTKKRSEILRDKASPPATPKITLPKPATPPPAPAPASKPAESTPPPAAPASAEPKPSAPKPAPAPAAKPNPPPAVSTPPAAPVTPPAPAPDKPAATTPETKPPAQAPK
jgi:hypothetical protein